MKSLLFLKVIKMWLYINSLLFLRIYCKKWVRLGFWRDYYNGWVVCEFFLVF